MHKLSFAVKIADFWLLPFAEEVLERAVDTCTNYVRTAVKTNITELLGKIPQYFEHLSTFSC